MVGTPPDARERAYGEVLGAALVPQAVRVLVQLV
jgi:hypothetical protein